MLNTHKCKPILVKTHPVGTPLALDGIDGMMSWERSKLRGSRTARREGWAVISSRLRELCSHFKPNDWVVIDEIQKIPGLLDVVHWHYQKKKLRFAVTGSSARKLKKTHANLLAGRLLDIRFFPLTYPEFDRSVDLELCIRLGSLPGIAKNYASAIPVLQSYDIDFVVQTRKPVMSKREIVLVEVKYGKKFRSDWRKGPNDLSMHSKDAIVGSHIVYNGNERLQVHGIDVWPAAMFLEALFNDEILP